MPLIQILMPLIIMGFVFVSIGNVGYWNDSNYALFLIMGYQVTLVHGIINSIPSSFKTEKEWRTISGLIIAPLHRFVVLFGMLVSKLILIAAPFVILLVIGLIIYPISFLTFAAILATYFFISLIFMGIGTILGVFAISKESLWKLSESGLSFLFMLSGLIYPVEIFPDIFQFFIKLNPMYYFFDFLRLLWIENDILLSISTHWFHVSILLICCVIIPLIAIYMFDKIYARFGIEG